MTVSVLKQMNFGNNLLCESLVELGEDEDLRDVPVSMTRARELLHSGHYCIVVECRKAVGNRACSFWGQE